MNFRRKPATTPRGKVPLSVKDTTAQDLLWEYAQRRRVVDAEFSDDLEAALKAAGHQPDVAGRVRAILLVPVLEKQLHDADAKALTWQQKLQEEEAARWQERIAASILAAGLTPFNAIGNDSGDPLDFTDDQVREALARLNNLLEVADANTWRAIHVACAASNDAERALREAGLL
jgi:hypothetical protein